MLIRILRIILPILGIAILIFQLMHIGGNYRGLDSPLWGLLLGIGLIIAPFTALGMLAVYLMIVGIPLGLAFLGTLVWVEIFGKGMGAIVGFFGGGVLGLKFVMSDSFDKLIEPFRTLKEKADLD